jgi:rSAM/selenodomain-associated transferase 1
MTQERHCAIAVMAKTPRAGRVKTRLVPPLCAEEAAALGSSFLADVTANIQAAARRALIRGFVAYAPAGTLALFEGIVAQDTGYVLADGSCSLPSGVDGIGRCLLHAAQALFAQGFASVCLLNADSPNLPTAILTRAAEALAAPGDRVVLGPAEDGGYYLIGMTAPHAQLFEEVAWSTEHVATQTRARARSLGLEVVELPTWYDVDDASSLRVLLAELAGEHVNGTRKLLPFPAPATTRCIAQLGLAIRLAEPAPASTLPSGIRQAG